MTRWLSHCPEAQRVLDQFEALITASDTIYLQKREAAVWGVRDDPTKSKAILSLCFSASAGSYKCATNCTAKGTPQFSSSTRSY